MSQLHCVVHVAQLKCWVGTAGGSLGVFTVTRSVGEPLQLEKTGNFVCMYILVFGIFSVFKTFLTRRRPAEEFSYYKHSVAWAVLCNTWG